MKTIIKVILFQEIENVDVIASRTAGAVVWIQAAVLIYSIVTK